MAKTIYCLQNKKQCTFTNKEIKETSKGKKYMIALCDECKKNHSKFLKQDKKKVEIKEVENKEVTPEILESATIKKRRGRKPKLNKIQPVEVEIN